MQANRPTLSVNDVRAILRNAGFVHKRTRGSHEHWEGKVKEERRVVTLDVHCGPFTPRSPLLSSMIRQSGFSKNDFYAHR